MIKTAYYLLCPALLALIIFAGCKKEPAAKITSGHYLNASSATIGSFSAIGTNVVSAGAAGLKIAIVGRSASGSSIYINLNPYSGTTGLYSIATTNETACIYYPAPGSSGSSTYATSGTITLTAVAPDLIGTFNFVATDGSTFSGSFNAPAP